MEVVLMEVDKVNLNHHVYTKEAVEKFIGKKFLVGLNNDFDSETNSEMNLKNVIGEIEVKRITESNYLTGELNLFEGIKRDDKLTAKDIGEMITDGRISIVSRGIANPEIKDRVEYIKSDYELVGFDAIDSSKSAWK